MSAVSLFDVTESLHHWLAFTCLQHHFQTYRARRRRKGRSQTGKGNNRNNGSNLHGACCQNVNSDRLDKTNHLHVIFGDISDNVIAFWNL